MKVLLAIDGSRYSADAVEAMATRPWPANTTIHVICVAELDQPLSVTRREGRTVGIELETLTKAARELTDLVVNSLETKGLSVTPVIPIGDPREAIVNEAKSWGADLIIISAYGHSGVKRWQLGSVAESVVKYAPCSVEVVRKASEEME